MTLIEFAAVLAGAGVPVHHNTAPELPGSRYIVWQEYGGRFSYGDNTPGEGVRRVQVDFYTKIELDPSLSALLAALDGADIAHGYPETTFDEEQACDRHIIECEVM